MAFKVATKAAAKLRLGLIGPAGSGKTMTALRIASGLGGRIAVIDTERGSASLYAGERGLAFDVEELDTYEVERFIQAIRDAAEAGYSTVVIDSLSHAWAGKGGILEYVDNAGKRNQGGGNFGAWRDATPRHNALVDAILGAPMHVICTLRSKVEYVVENVGGRNQVRKVGLQPVQRDGLEYEFTVVGDVSQDHDLVVTKTRAAWLKDAVIREAGEDLGKKLAAWLSEGTAGPVEAIRRPPATVEPESAQAPPPDTRASGRLVARALLLIGKAATAFECDELRERIDARLVAGEISNAEAEELLVQLDARESAIRAKEEAADAVA
jgi:nucleoside-triphosphatase THEP1